MPAVVNANPAMLSAAGHMQAGTSAMMWTAQAQAQAMQQQQQAQAAQMQVLALSLPPSLPLVLPLSLPASHSLCPASSSPSA